jgi:hypothetical protein
MANYLCYAYEGFATYRYISHGLSFSVFSVTLKKRLCEVRSRNRLAMGISPLQGILPRAGIYYLQINSETELASGTLLKELGRLGSLKMII